MGGPWISQTGKELIPAERTQAPGPIKPRGRPKRSKNKPRKTEESVQRDAEEMPREARSVQTNAGDRHREARPREARYVQTDAGDRHKKARENTGRGVESQPVNDEDPTRQKTSSKGPTRKIGERSSMEVDSTKGIIPARALIEPPEKRKKLTIRPPKPPSEDGARILSIKGVSNGIIIPKTYYKAVNDPVYN